MGVGGWGCVVHVGEGVCPWRGYVACVCGLFDWLRWKSPLITPNKQLLTKNDMLTSSLTSGCSCASWTVAWTASMWAHQVTC